MSVPGSSLGSPVAQAGVELERVRALQSRIAQMQRSGRGGASLATLPALAPALPGGALQTGTVYSVPGSMALLMGLLAGPSAAGSWCGVIGIPEFGVEAAARSGIDLERLVLVPYPGAQWLTVAATLADALAVVAVRSPTQVSDADAARLSARLRQRDSALIVLGDWPRSEAILTVSGSSWEGLGYGHGYPSARRVTINTSGRSGRVLNTRIWLPDAHEKIRSVEPETAHATSPQPGVLPRLELAEQSSLRIVV